MAEETNHNFSLLSLGKPIEKLIETIGKAVGVLYKPRAIRNEADAEAYKIEVIANAKGKAAIIKSEAEHEINERAKTRLYHQEVQRQINLESVIEKAANYLSETVSDEPVDEDWRARFFSKVQDVSSEDLQNIWGRILANEIAQPNGVSLRTLDVLSNLSREEAVVFTKLAGITSNNGNIYKSDKVYFNRFGITYNELILMREAGLLHNLDNMLEVYDRKSMDRYENKLGFFVSYGQLRYFVYNPHGHDTRFRRIPLTTAGIELLNIVGRQVNMEYVNYFLELVKQKKYACIPLK